jgi:biopolymer transport protein ExbD
VIFLLLLFFMLSSTFTRFAEVELTSAGAGSAQASGAPVFLSLAVDGLRINGSDATLADLSDALRPLRDDAGPLQVLIAPQADVTAQRLTDVLAALRIVPNLSVTILEAT